MQLDEEGAGVSGGTVRPMTSSGSTYGGVLGRSDS